MTIEGDSFPNRVASSLYESFNSNEFYTIHDRDGNNSFNVCSWEKDVSLSDILVTNSLKEMEDTAISLLKRQRVLDSLRKGLSSMVSNSCGIFSAERAAIQFMRGMQAVFESKKLERFLGRPHVIVS